MDRISSTEFFQFPKSGACKTGKHRAFLIPAERIDKFSVLENFQKSFHNMGPSGSALQFGHVTPSSGLKLRWASPGLHAFPALGEACQRSRRIPALLGYFHRIARLNMQFRLETRKRRLQPFVLFDDKSYTRKVHPLWIPQTSQWFLSTYREGALPALLQGVSLIKATILEKQNWIPWRRHWLFSPRLRV